MQHRAISRIRSAGAALCLLVCAACGPGVSEGQGTSTETSGSSAGTGTDAGSDATGSGVTSVGETVGPSTTEGTAGTDGEVSCGIEFMGEGRCAVGTFVGYFERVFVRVGSGAGEFSCSPSEDPQPCGGELAGTEWTLSAVCLPSVDVYGQTWRCEAPTFSTTAYDETFVLDFAATTVHREASGNWSYTFSVKPADCEVADCRELEACNNDGSGLTASCENIGDVCMCAATSALSAIEADGEYTVSDDRIVSSVLTDGAHPYCVEGDRLTLWSPRYEYSLTDMPCGGSNGASCSVVGGPPDELPGYCHFY